MTHANIDTIAAIATPPGAGGIAVIRISGPDSLKVIDQIFTPSKAGSNFSFKPRFMHHGHAKDVEGRTLDEVLAVFMPGPGTATGEDVAEVHCHGGQGVASALLESVIQAGARLAGRGEFTRRAFLNGRIDLTQAEAVAELIAAPTREGARLAKAKLDGHLGAAVRALRSNLDRIRMQIAAAVDFPDEDLELLPRVELAAQVEETVRAIDEMQAAFKRARLWREGALVVLAGCVNAGKSSLLNALLGRSRAIVSPTPGTTRDYIEENIEIDGMLLRLADTAGMRATADAIEEEGIRLTESLASEADLILLVMDVHKGFTAEEKSFIKNHSQTAGTGRLLLLMNKLDSLPDAALPQEIDGCPVLGISAKEGTGLVELGRAISTRLCSEKEPGTPVSDNLATDLAPNLRQSALLEKARLELKALLTDVENGQPADILSVGLETAAMHLDDVVGRSTSDEILDQVFASFCIGK